MPLLFHKDGCLRIGEGWFPLSTVVGVFVEEVLHIQLPQFKLFVLRQDSAYLQLSGTLLVIPTRTTAVLVINCYIHLDIHTPLQRTAYLIPHNKNYSVTELVQVMTPAQKLFTFQKIW